MRRPGGARRLELRIDDLTSTEETTMSPQFKSVYRDLCFLLVAQTLLSGSSRAIQPSDCQPRNMDSSCAQAVDQYPNDPPPSPPPPPKSFSLAGQPASGYWYWGYDFATADAEQQLDPRYVNRSGQPLNITLSFTIPASRCGGGCLPGVEFYFDQDVHKRDPQLQVSGTTAKAVVPLKPGDSYGFIIGLWQALDPTISVTSADGTPVSPELAGMSARPDNSSLVPGTPTTCLCEDGAFAECYLGDHYSNGLSGRWSQTIGLARLNAWTQCQKGGT
jgi:hypothetical protein